MRITFIQIKKICEFNYYKPHISRRSKERYVFLFFIYALCPFLIISSVNMSNQNNIPLLHFSEEGFTITKYIVMVLSFNFDKKYSWFHRFMHLTNRTQIRRVISYINITTSRTPPFFHSKSSSFLDGKRRKKVTASFFPYPKHHFLTRPA